ncbi:hypothetical protein [Actibacterium sp. MT2.3-13A]|uniref:hypothetical protein n=1 Tax=Actibacterium sp. MT2.3-13A TaxID=2828332 RepID=UPI001BA7A989|nr:hypothetical protein [Actibacterium sp. MT2.3-13A]
MPDEPIAKPHGCPLIDGKWIAAMQSLPGDPAEGRPKNVERTCAAMPSACVGFGNTTRKKRGSFPVAICVKMGAVQGGFALLRLKRRSPRAGMPETSARGCIGIGRAEGVERMRQKGGVT